VNYALNISLTDMLIFFGFTFKIYGNKRRCAWNTSDIATDQKISI